MYWDDWFECLFVHYLWLSCFLGVGSNLQDHLELYVQQQCTQPITLYKAQKPFHMVKIGLEWLTLFTGKRRHLHMHMGTYTFSNMFYKVTLKNVLKSYEVPFPQVHFTLSVLLIDSENKSYGQVYGVIGVWRKLLFLINMQIFTAGFSTV